MNKKSKFKQLSENTLLFVISGFGTRIITFLFVPLYTYILSTNEYGLVDLIVTTVQILIPILTLNIQDAVLRFSLEKKYKQEDCICIGLCIIAMSSALLGIALVLLRYCGLLILENNYTVFLILMFIIGSLNNILSMYLKAKNQVNVLAVCGLISTVITCILNVLLLLIFQWGINGYMVAYISGTLVANVGLIFLGKVIKDVKIGTCEAKIGKTMILYSAPLIANSIGWWINNASDRYILTYFCGTEINGIYAISYKIPAILSALQSVFYNAWSISAITEFDKNDKDGFIGDTYKIYSSLSFLACSFIMMFNIWIARILYAKDFFVAWKYVPFLLVGTVFNGLGLFNGCIFTAVKKTKEISITTIIGATVNTVLNFTLIPYIGPYGAAFATMIGYFTIWAVRTVRMKKIIELNINWYKQMTIIVVLLIQCIVASINNLIIYQIPFALIILFLQKNILFKVFKTALNYIEVKIWKKDA